MYVCTCGDENSCCYLQTLQTSRSTEDSLQEELKKLQSKLEEEVATHKRDNETNSSHVATLESQLREGKEKMEQLQLERKEQTLALQEEIKKLSKELSDNKVCTHVYIHVHVHIICEKLMTP